MTNKIVQAFNDWDGATSMTRVVAFMFALVICTGLVVMAVRDHLHDMGWPFAAVAIVTLLAVPLQALCKAIVEFMKSKPGKDLLANLISKVTAVPLGLGADTTSAVTTTTTVAGE